MPDGQQQLRGSLLALRYFDAASGQSVTLGSIQDCQGELLDFASMQMPAGRAFLSASANSSSTPVFQRWIETEGRTFLVEEIPFSELKPLLATLPRQARATVPSDRSADDHVRKTVLWEALRRQPGVVLHWQLLTSAQISFSEGTSLVGMACKGSPIRAVSSPGNLRPPLKTEELTRCNWRV